MYEAAYPEPSKANIVIQVTYELQPPSYTSLKLLTGPPRGGGGDTLWASQYAVYDALSVPMQKYLGMSTLESLLLLFTRLSYISVMFHK